MMIRSTLIGLWSCAVALGSAYLGMQWGAPGQTSGDKAAAKPKLVHVRIKPISVPIVTDGKVGGYVVAQMSYTAPAEQLKKLEVKPDVFIYDAAFNGIYSRQRLDIATLRDDSWKEFASYVRDSVNERLGIAVVHSLVIEEFGYVPYDQARGADVPGGAKDQGPRRKAAGGAH